ncbi:hypothetical protein [Marilutibacter maris]|uniref:hypothetical protein n=1 Tax=Marilutibacter maris TaxID=1605891 RepID=UPI00147964A0|nr:hypothetical protein [Lysobacter maris]
MPALQLLREDPVFERVAPDERTLAARIYFESIEEVDAVPGQGPGYVFFPMEA